MATTTEYLRGTSFTDYQSAAPTDPISGPALDGEFDRIKITTDTIRQSLDLIQRDDGALANQSVSFDQLDAALSVGLSPSTEWATGTNYYVHNTVFVGGDDSLILYKCLVSHLSGADFATDLAAGKWDEFVDFTPPVVTAAQASADAADASATAAAASAAANAPYASYAAAQAASVPTAVQHIYVLEGVHLFEYVKDGSGVDLTTADGATWRLPGKGLVSAQAFYELDTTFVGKYGGLAIQDTIDTTKKRSVFRIDRTVTDLATADFTDPLSGAFTQPQLVEVSYTVNGEYGTDGSGARGCKLFSGKLVNNSNQPGNMANYTLFNGGISPKASWGGGVIEMYDTSSALGLSTIGDPDQDPLADTAGVVGNTMIGLEINGKMKANTTFVGLQIMPRTYGRVVTDEGRPKADRCIYLGPSRNGSDVVGGSYLDDATGADILRMIDMSSGPSDGSNAARTDYGLWSRMPFEVAAIALPLTDNIIFDNNAGTPNQLKLFGSSAGVLAISANGGTNNVAEFRAANLTVRNSIDIDTQSTTPQNRVIDFNTDGALRHRISVDNTSESGSNQGSYAHWYSYADDGTTATEIFSISRQSHIIDFKNQVRMSGLPTSDPGVTGQLWIDTAAGRVLKVSA